LRNLYKTPTPLESISLKYARFPIQILIPLTFNKPYSTGLNLNLHSKFQTKGGRTISLE